jgi:ribosomal protein S18 acetylase RimI-like enzyme
VTETTQASDGIIIRRASGTDAEQLARLGAETFTETFGHLYPQRDLTVYLQNNHAPAHYAAWATDPTYAVFIAERRGQAIGYALAGPCQLPHPDVTINCGELRRLYVRRSAQGLGLGRRLLDEALNWLERPGRRLWLGVWSENHGAQRLYARYGFTAVGRYEFSVGDSRDLDFVFARPAL